MLTLTIILSLYMAVWVGVGVEGLPWILSDEDDRMGAKIRTKKTPGSKLNLPKIPCKIFEPYKFPEALNHIT